MAERPKAVVATVSSDSHSWNLSYIQLVLEELGYEVVNVGPCSSVDCVVQRVREASPELIVLSSVNGHGYIEAPAYGVALRSIPGSSSFLLVIGGKLTTGDNMKDAQVDRLRHAGFDAVFVGINAMPNFCRFVAGTSSATAW